MAQFVSGKLYGEMIVSAANALENKKEDVNNLNVFPVPDGDTGSNMGMTMGVIRNNVGNLSNKLGDCATQVSKMMLMAARGNSGVILSLFFKGLAKGLEGVDRADATTLAKAFDSGVKSAYGAVMQPTEGTILTVMRVSAEKTIAVVDEFQDDPLAMMNYMLDAAKETLEETPEMLPVLKSANVVDAGGFGFVTVLEGMIAALMHQPIQYAGAPSAGRQIVANFAQVETGDIVFGYCTECIVEKDPDLCTEERIDSLRATLSEMGDSMVFAQDDEIIKLHIHTNEPGIVLSLAQVFGALVTVKVENMRRQHTEMIQKTVGRSEETAQEAVIHQEPTKEFGFVAVAAGEGVSSAFIDMGCDQMVIGGQTMNPSLADLIGAVGKVNAETVFILPNNSNVYLAACQAAKEINDKKIIVLPTKTIPQGLTALFAFDESVSADENEESMTAALDNVKSFSLTYAVHDSTADGMDIKEGQSLGLLNGKVRYNADTDEECLKLMLEEMKDGITVTVFYGEDVDDETAAGTEALLTDALPMADVTVLKGDQPVYKYIISCE